MTTAQYLLLGLAAGVFSGLVGVGGGIIIVPALVIRFGFTQHRAQGTTLALLVPPIGLLAVLQYYRHGDVDIPAAALIAAGFVVGGLLGGTLATSLSGVTLARIFAAALIAVGIKMLISG